MSLIKQLWLSVILLMAISFGGSFMISLISSKNYLIKELQTKNIDNANSLALSMSQMDKDMVNLELLIAAQFDAGHYRLIQLSDPTGKLLIERKKEGLKADVPAWFVKLVPISIVPGYAQVNDGWTQYGTVKLETDTLFAYRDLWEGGKVLLIVSLIASIITAYVGTLILKRILKPLDQVISQAEAIGNHRFITNTEPRTPEFRKLVVVMNRLSERVRAMLHEESGRLEKLRQENNYDALTRLMNRAYFFSRTDAYMNNEESFASGVLVVSRINNLSEIDKAVGHNDTDAMLVRFGEAIEAFVANSPQMMAGRVSGKDIAVFSGEDINPFNLASKVNGLLSKVANLAHPAPELELITVSSPVQKGEGIGSLFEKVETVVTELIANKSGALHVIGQADIDKQQDLDEEAWRLRLTEALDKKRIKLAHYPVMSVKGHMIHQESPVRMQLVEDGPWVSAGEFISWANRLNLVNAIDLLVVESALSALQSSKVDIGLNISSQALRNQAFIEAMSDLIGKQPKVAKRLWLEVPERGVFDYLEDFRNFCNILKPLGCKIGIEHVGAYVSRLGELHDLGLDYIKIDISIISGIHQNPGNQAFLRGLCLIAHSIGLMTIAEGVQSAEEVKYLPELGLDGMTGPAVK